MFLVDYQAGLEDARYRINLSFSFLAWKMTEQIVANELPLDAIDEASFMNMLYNITPTGLTILHQAHNDYELIDDIFKAIHPDPENPATYTMEIPFLQNVDGISPMDLCLKHGQYTTADLILKYLKHYPFDHHSRALESALPHLVEKEVPEFLPYIESRVRESSLTKKLNRGLINEDSQGLAVSCFRINLEEVKEQLFQKGKNESEVETKIIDLPKVHDY